MSEVYRTSSVGLPTHRSQKKLPKKIANKIDVAPAKATLKHLFSTDSIDVGVGIPRNATICFGKLARGPWALTGGPSLFCGSRSRVGAARRCGKHRQLTFPLAESAVIQRQQCGQLSGDLMTSHDLSKLTSCSRDSASLLYASK